MAAEPSATAPPVRPRRTILGMSAILLPLHESGPIDWDALEAHVVRTRAAGLVPAVNMDTGYVQLLDAGTRNRILDLAAAATAGHGHTAAGDPDPTPGPLPPAPPWPAASWPEPSSTTAPATRSTWPRTSPLLRPSPPGTALR